jgi:SAM-dependent methyltransferase
MKKIFIISVFVVIMAVPQELFALRPQASSIYHCRSADRKGAVADFDNTYRNNLRYARRGLAIYQKSLDGYIIRRFSRHLRRFKERIESGEDIVVADIGAGGGLPFHQMLEYLDPNGKHTRGIGITFSKFFHPHTPYPNEYYTLADIFDGMPLRNESVDIGVSVAGPRPCDVEEFIILINELVRILKPGGAIFYQIDNARYQFIKESRALRDLLARNDASIHIYRSRPRHEKGRVLLIEPPPFTKTHNQTTPLLRNATYLSAINSAS